MANPLYDKELEEARGNLRSLIDKSETLQRSGGNLDKNGEPSLTARRGDVSFTSGGRDESAAARSSMRGPEQFTRTPGNRLPSSDAHITGQVGGGQTRRPNQMTWGEGPEPKRPEEAMIRSSRLNVPAVRPMRPANEAGATSFHFSHEAISKTRAEKITARGTKNRAGAASAHTSYIERDSAVAKVEKDDQNRIAADLADQAKSNPELAAQLGIAGGDGERAPESLVERDKQPLGTGALASAYIEREEALAHDPNGVAVLFSNISESADERREFWQLVEEAESDPSADRMQLRISGYEEFWSNVAADPDCPKKLRQTIAAAEPSEIVFIRTGNNQQVRELMKKHGWKAREKRDPNETDEQRLAREEREAASAFGAKFEDGRGGRVQFRVVGELPHEVPHEARVRILKEFADEFEARQLPYIAVMHAPDHTNDDRNWHFHLVYHDRPAKRFTGEAKDHLKSCPADAGSKKVRQHEIAIEALADSAIQKHVGKWDFTVPWSYKRSNRHTVETTPFAQFKDREVTRRPFIPMLRRHLASLTNRELEAAGVARRVDPRRYTEMGIHKDSDEHLGTKAAALEAVGVPTEQGIRNELNQWEFIQRKLAAQAKVDQARIDKQVRDWQREISARNFSDQDKDQIEKNLIRWEQAERIAAEHRAIAKNIDEHLGRLRSRALKVSKMAKKHLEAIKLDLATRRQAQNKSRYEEKFEEAQIHLSGLEVLMDREIKQGANSLDAAKRHSVAADTAKLIIEAAIGQAPLEVASPADGIAAKSSNDNRKTPQAANDIAGVDNTANSTSQQGRIGNSQFDSWVNSLVQGNRRIVLVDGVYRPRILRKADAPYVSAPNFKSVQGRLAKIHEHTEASIATFAGAIQRKEVWFSLFANAQYTTDEVTMASRMRLITNDQRMQATYRAYGDEPELDVLLKPIFKAMLQKQADLIATIDAEDKARKEQARGPLAPKPTMVPSQENGGQATPSEEAAVPDQQAQVPASTRNTKTPRPANDHGQLIETVRSNHLRPRITADENALVLEFSKADAALWKLPDHVRIEDARSIARMNGVIKTNERNARRLLAYIEKFPEKVEKARSGEGYDLVANAPAELRDISKHFKRDLEIARAMENATIEARLQAADPRSVEQKKPAPTPASNVQDYGRFKIVDGVPVVDPLKQPVPATPTAVPTPSRPVKPVEPERERTRIPIDPSRRPAHGHQQAEPRKTYRNIKHGIHPLFDEWLNAKNGDDLETRQRVAAAIERDKELREIAKTFVPGIVEMMREDRENFAFRGRGLGGHQNERDRSDR
jgi:hypothetical protein